MRIIQFTGAQGVGKTTLVRAIMQDNPGLKFVGEVSRNLLTSGYVSNIDSKASMYDQLAIDAELILQYLEAVLDNPEKRDIICERTAIDCLAYTYTLKADTAIDDVRKSYLEQLARNFITVVQKYGIQVYTFYIPPRLKFVDDGVRSIDSQQDIDDHIRSILFDMRIPYFTLNAVDLDKRLGEFYRVFNR